MKTIQKLDKELSQLKYEYTKKFMDLLPPYISNNLLEFYPGGSGLIDKNGKIPANCTMFIGQDFGTIGYYEDLKNGKIKLDPTRSFPFISTWNFLDKIINDNNLKYADLFFTNPINGVRREQSMTGKNKGLSNPDFLNECAEYIKAQIKYVEPKSVIILGKAPIAIFKKAFPNSTFKDVDESNSFKQLDEKGLLFHKIREGDLSFNTCIIIHPSMRNSNKNNYLLLEENGVSPERRLIQQLN